MIIRKTCLPTCLCLLLPVLLAGCRHTITFNDNVLYSPNASIREGILQDPSLQGCLNQALATSGQEDPETVTLLACPGAGVRTLAGIEALPNLEQLELSDNVIVNLSPLAELKNLRVLSIRNNAVGDVRPLANLPILRFLSLEGNDRIPCGQIDSLQEKLGNTLNRPLNCID